MSSEYWDTLLRLLPVSILGGVVAMILRLPEYPKAVSGWRRAYLVVSTITVGAVAALVAGLSLPLLPFPRIPEVELLIGAVAGSCGQKIFDAYAGRFLGIHNRRASDFTCSDAGVDADVDAEDKDKTE